jgi:RHS repeat-associated protein
MDEDVIRRRNTQYSEETVEVDTFHYNDPLGTVKEQGEPDRGGGGTQNGYVITAEGEPLPISGGQPTEENHIRFHGGFLEDKEFHPASGYDRGHLYRMGVRHYSPSLGRFLQREPLLNNGPANFEFPLHANPYCYSINRPTQLSDTSGYQATLGGRPAEGGFTPTPVGRGCGAGCGGGGTYSPEPPGGGMTCAVQFPPESWCDKCMGCCCYAGHECPADVFHCNTSCAGDWVCYIPPKWPLAMCRCWCCGHDCGGENAPAKYKAPGGAYYYYGPPKYGPGGRGGIPRHPWLPLPEPAWPYPLLPDIRPLSSYISLGQIDPLPLNISQIASPLVINIEPIIEMLMDYGVHALTGIPALCDWLLAAVIEVCLDVPEFSKNFKLKDWQFLLCMQNACCSYEGCASGSPFGDLRLWLTGICAALAGLFIGFGIGLGPYSGLLAVAGFLVGIHAGGCETQFRGDVIRCFSKY